MKRFLTTILMTVGLVLPIVAAEPQVGEKAADFTLNSIEGKEVKLSKMLAGGPVALVVLRGFPGYQCPLCNRQVQDMIKNADGFEKAGLRVLFVYPGPGEGLTGKANEFLTDKKLPANMTMVTDPDYVFTNLYQLRWDAPKETAYPSTFILSSQGVIKAANVSKSHGGRTTAADVLKMAAGL